jgi:hypothetical protein
MAARIEISPTMKIDDAGTLSQVYTPVSPMTAGRSRRIRPRPGG